MCVLIIDFESKWFNLKSESKIHFVVCLSKQIVGK